MSYIPYADQGIDYIPDPGRVLFSGGEWRVPEEKRPANWRERMKAIDIQPPKPKRDIAKERQRAKDRGVAKAFKFLVNYSPNSGFQPGHEAYNRKTEITDEQIRRLREEEGLSYQEIGKRLGIHPSTAHLRLNGRKRRK